MKNDNLLVFFNGWGMDDLVVRHLSANGYDFISFSDYTNLKKTTIENFNDYKTKTLVAWSFGVLMAAYHLPEYKFDRAIAVNGTIRPIDSNFGIVPEIFKATLDNLDAENLMNFYKRCCHKPSILNDFLAKRPQKELIELKSELEYLQSIYHKNSNLHNIFNIALIGKQDRIFLPENQRNYWQNKAIIIEKALPHFPFHGFNSWKEFIDTASGQ